ncbi:MAG: hypothetical protein MI919_15345 [Holophagales bacterium]|nr:hypothetical protein [Holophagales bacterium]
MDRSHPPGGTPAFGELFLTYPDLFPARAAGEPWGRSAVAVDFVGGPYLFQGLIPGQAETLLERFGPLASPVADPSAAGPGAVPIRVLRVGDNEFREVSVEGWCYTFDRDYHPDHLRVAGLRFMARLDGLDAGPESFPPAACLYTPEAGGPYFLSQVENFFRLLVAYRLLELGGVLLHSAGVVAKGRAYVFSGHSGAGKTTISRLALASGRQVLSDDMNALCWHREPDGENGKGRARVEKLPFAGDLGRTPAPRASHPLAALCRLKKGEATIRPLGRAEAVAFFVGCAPFVNVDPHRLDRLGENLERITGNVPVHELRFPKSGGFWHLLEESGDADGGEAAERQ